MSTVTVLPGPERRRRWTTAEKLRIVEESLERGHQRCRIYTAARPSPQPGAHLALAGDAVRDFEWRSSFCAGRNCACYRCLRPSARRSWATLLADSQQRLRMPQPKLKPSYRSLPSPTKELLDAQSTWSRQELQAMNDRFVAAVKRAIEQERKRAPQQTPSRSDAA